MHEHFSDIQNSHFEDFGFNLRVFYTQKIKNFLIVIFAKQKNMAKKQKDAYEKFAGYIKNEPDFEEELEAEGIDVKEAELKHFEEEDE